MSFVYLIHWAWAISELWQISYQCMQFGIYMLMTINIKSLGCWLRHYLYSLCEWTLQWRDSFLKETCLVRKLQSIGKAEVKLWLGSILIKPENGVLVSLSSATPKCPVLCVRSVGHVPCSATVLSLFDYFQWKSYKYYFPIDLWSIRRFSFEIAMQPPSIGSFCDFFSEKKNCVDSSSKECLVLTHHPSSLHI